MTDEEWELYALNKMREMGGEKAAQSFLKACARRRELEKEKAVRIASQDALKGLCALEEALFQGSARTALGLIRAIKDLIPVVLKIEGADGEGGIVERNFLSAVDDIILRWGGAK